MNKDPLDTYEPMDDSAEELPNVPKRAKRRETFPSQFTDSRRNSEDTYSFNELAPFLIGNKRDTNQTVEPIENKFDEYWSIVLNSEIPDKAAADKFLKKKNLRNLRVMHYSRLCITNYFFQLIMTIIIFYTLILINFKFLVAGKGADVGFDIFTLISMFAFIFELILNLYGDIEYFNSFYFYIDITSIFLLFFDLSWVREGAFGTVKDPNKTVAYIVFGCFTTFSLVRVLKVIKYIFQKQRILKYPPA